MVKLSDDAKKFVDRIEREMKRGFISTIVLFILRNYPSHGYQIIKNIEQHTIWHASASSIYPILKNLSRKGFISCEEIKDGERIRKVYNLTKKGEQVLELVNEKQQNMIESINSIMDLHSLNSTESPSEINLSSPNSLLLFMKPNLEKVIDGYDMEKLQLFKRKIEFLINHFNHTLHTIDEKISKFQKK